MTHKHVKFYDEFRAVANVAKKMANNLSVLGITFCRTMMYNIRVGEKLKEILLEALEVRIQKTVKAE